MDAPQVIVFKLIEPDNSKPSRTEIPLPVDSKILSAGYSNGRLVVAVRHGMSSTMVTVPVWALHSRSDLPEEKGLHYVASAWSYNVGQPDIHVYEVRTRG